VTDTATPLERIAAALESIAASLARLASAPAAAAPQQPAGYRTVSAPRG
jgi:hypothetical protein